MCGRPLRNVGTSLLRGAVSGGVWFARREEKRRTRLRKEQKGAVLGKLSPERAEEPRGAHTARPLLSHARRAPPACWLAPARHG